MGLGQRFRRRPGRVIGPEGTSQAERSWQRCFLQQTRVFWFFFSKKNYFFFFKRRFKKWFKLHVGMTLAEALQTLETDPVLRPP
jgi:hypothetical protein